MYMCIKEWILHLSSIFQLDFGTVPTMWYFCFILFSYMYLINHVHVVSANTLATGRMIPSGINSPPADSNSNENTDAFLKYVYTTFREQNIGYDQI